MQEPTPGRRESRRAAIWRSVHESAVQEVFERGLADATVASISARAGVAPRTFFNYFPTKEDAVLGTREPVLSDGLLAAFLADRDDPLARTARLVAGVLRTGTDAGPAFRRRRELVRTFPELRGRTLQHVQAAEMVVAAALAERVTAAERAKLAESLGRETGESVPDAGNTGPDAVAAQLDEAVVDARLAALLMLAGTVVRYAFTRDPEGFHVDHVGAVDAALAVFRGVLGATSPASAP